MLSKRIALMSLARMVFAFAQASVEGAWTGKVDISGVKYPEKAGSERIQAQVLLKRMAASKVSLQLKRDHSYVFTLSPPKESPSVDKGTWSLTKSDLLLKSGEYKLRGTVSKDGKSIVMNMPGTGGAKIVLKKS